MFNALSLTELSDKVLFNISIINIIKYFLYAFFILIFVIISYSFVNFIGNSFTTRYFIDENYLTRKTKVLNEIWEDVPIKQITHMEYTISWFWDKIFNTGSIYFYTSGSNFADLKFYSVNSVSEIYEQIWAKVDFFRKDIIGKKEIKLIKTVKPNVMVATLFITVFVSLFASPIIKYYVLVLIPFVIIFSIFVYKRRRYDFYTDRLEYYDGFLTFHKVTVPLERITNIDLMSTMTDRIFGVSTINIETAGSNLSEIIINYVNDGERIVSELKEVLKENGRN
jgi:uncharacterized membrane protein YdbT with pleckstrin-like domain